MKLKTIGVPAMSLSRKTLFALFSSSAGNIRKLLTLSIIFCFVPTCFAQLTHQQKLDDFRSLVGLYNKQYAPYEWKVEAFDFDLLKLDDWLAQVNSAHDDLTFYDVCVRYAASLQDSHDEFILPSSYEAYLPLLADRYDGKVLIDFIDRTALPQQTYPFTIGDELISVDGKDVEDWVVALGAYAVNGQGNPVSRDRLAIATILNRYQGFYPFANRIRPGDIGTIVVRDQNGNTGTYKIPWVTIRTPFDGEGPVPNPGGKPFVGRTTSSENSPRRSMRQKEQTEKNSWGIWTGERPSSEIPTAPKGLERIQSLTDASVLEPDHVVAGDLFPFSALFPAFAPPPGFKLRLGSKSTDEFVSGTFPVAGRTIGFIRIPSFAPVNRTNAINQFRAETIFFQQNTSGLVVDLMSNGGGNICYANNLVQFLSPEPFEALSARLRATRQWLVAFESILLFQQFNGIPQSDIDLTAGMIEEIQRALSENRGLTDPIQAFAPASLCNRSGGLLYPPAKDSQGNNIAYNKPILLLTDNFTISSAEMFAAKLQDLNRVSVYGVRTDGGGGNVVPFNYLSGPYGEGSVRVTQSIMVRNHNVSTAGLPSAPYIENIGIQPDFIADFKTRSNLLTAGQPFVSGFSQAISELIGEGP
jgi:peptidase S41-like protein/PDZ domain-containing protein